MASSSECVCVEGWWWGGAFLRHFQRILLDFLVTVTWGLGPLLRRRAETRLDEGSQRLAAQNSCRESAPSRVSDWREVFMGPEPVKAGLGVQGGASDGEALFSVEGGLGCPWQKAHGFRSGWLGQQSQPFPLLPCAGAQGPTTPFPLGALEPIQGTRPRMSSLASRGWGGGVSSSWLSISCQMPQGGQNKCF